MPRCAPAAEPRAARSDRRSTVLRLSTLVISLWIVLWLQYATLHVGPVEIPDLRSLRWLLAAAAVVLYASSLLFERWALRRENLTRLATRCDAAARARIPFPFFIILSAASVTVTIGFLAAVLAIGAMRSWAWVLFGLALVNLVHLQLRWPRYQRALDFVREARDLPREETLR